LVQAKVVLEFSHCAADNLHDRAEVQHLVVTVRPATEFPNAREITQNRMDGIH